VISILTLSCRVLFWDSLVIIRNIGGSDKETFKDKAEDILINNIRAMEVGYNHAKKLKTSFSLSIDIQRNEAIRKNY